MLGQSNGAGGTGAIGAAVEDATITKGRISFGRVGVALICVKSSSGGWTFGWQLTLVTHDEVTSLSAVKPVVVFEPACTP
jgi:hypothetical protein